jgi:RimJ/RimL family protein N-acetyltransferase
MMPEEITTGRLTLLPLRVEHAEEMAGVLDDPALHTFIGGSPDTAETLRTRYTRMLEGPSDPDTFWLNWVLRLRADDCLTGYVQATVSPGPVAEVAWVVGTAWQGRGLAREAAGALVEWLDRRSVPTIIAHIHPDHRASAAVATAVGLVATDEWHDGEVRWHRGSILAG